MNSSPDPQFATCDEIKSLLRQDAKGKWYCPKQNIKACNALKTVTVPNVQLREVQDDKDRISFAKCSDVKRNGGAAKPAESGL